MSHAAGRAEAATPAQAKPRTSWRPAAPLAPPDPAERHRLHSRFSGSSRRSPDRLSSPGLVEALAAGAEIDVERYTLDLRVLPQPIRRVEGSVRLQGISLQPGLATLHVDLFDNMTISAIRAGPTALAYARGGNVVSVALDRAYASGETVDITIEYGGTPAVVGYGSFTFREHSTTNLTPIIASLSEPDGAPAWWPCIDDPSDKAIVEVDLNVPAGFVAVSNGLLAATLTLPDTTRTYQWRSAYPISTYLVSVAITNYVTWTDTYEPVTGGPPMPVQHFVYPEHEAAARIDFAVTVPQLEFFSTLFGEYPFVDEKYGHAVFRFGGAMEHQTSTSWGSGFVRGDNAYHWVVAHELAHHWFGDSVGPDNWKEIWLNEGFATYSEALWYESLYGASGLRGYMASLDSRPFCGPVYDPTCGLFSNTVYEKGAWVLHMLRGIVGDAAFFDGLRNYASDFAYASATTPGFQAVMESASGRSLGSFFSRWVEQTGEPAYRWGWKAASTPAGWVTYVRIEQTQGSGPFEMPLALRVTAGGVVSDFTVENSSIGQTFRLPALPAAPTSVALDPDLWVLKSETIMALSDGDADGVPDVADNCLSQPNPAQDDQDADGIGDSCDADADGDGRLNPADCAPLDPSAQDPPTEVTGLLAAGGPALELSWDAIVPQPGGLTYDLLRGDAARLTIDSGISAAGCFASMMPSSPVVDSDLPGGGAAFYYLVRGRNACGAGTLGNSSSGEPRQPLACP